MHLTEGDPAGYAAVHACTSLGKEEGDDNEPDDVIAERAEGRSKGESLGEDRYCDSQESPSSRWQRFQHKPCQQALITSSIDNFKHRQEGKSLPV